MTVRYFRRFPRLAALLKKKVWKIRFENNDERALALLVQRNPGLQLAEVFQVIALRVLG